MSAGSPTCAASLSRTSLFASSTMIGGLRRDGDRCCSRTSDFPALLSSMSAGRSVAILRPRLAGLIKRLRLPLTGTLGFGRAEVTAGGIVLDEVDSRTMQSKRCPGLYFAGEVLDLDGPIGGYNFQAAWSTGWLAGTVTGR